jgi:F-type H+-transporting ATPase subunit delta
MSTKRIAGRYVKPIIELSITKGILEEVKSDMENIHNLCKESRDFLLMVKSPIIPHLRKAEVLKAIFAGKVNELTMAAIQLITRKNRAELIPNIVQEFIEEYNELKGLKEVEVTTTYELSEAEKDLFKELSNKISGKESILTTNTDPEIIGGFKLTIDNKQLDQTVKGKLKEIKINFAK